MRRRVLAVLTIVAVVAIGLVVATLTLRAPAATPAPAPVPDHWHVLRTGTRVRALAERRLYEVVDQPHFFVRLRVENLTDRPLGLDLRDYWRVFRPNQWGGLDRPARGYIDEAHMMPSADWDRGDAGRELRAAFTRGELVTIPAGGAIDYYVEFNASGRPDVDAVDTPFLYVSMDGELLLTNGVDAEQITLEQPLRDDADFDSDLIIEVPFAWGVVPADAIVVESP